MFRLCWLHLQADPGGVDAESATVIHSPWHQLGQVLLLLTVMLTVSRNLQDAFT